MGAIEGYRGLRANGDTAAGASQGGRGTMTGPEFVQLMRESVITQAVITIMMGGVITFMLITGRAVPSELWALNGLVIGFYFGGKVQAQAMRLRRELEGVERGGDDAGGQAARRRPKDGQRDSAHPGAAG